MMLLDVNVLMYAFHPNFPLHSETRRWLRDASTGDDRLLIPEIVLSGFLRIVTGSKLVAVPEPLDSALGFCDALLAGAACELVRGGPGQWNRFCELCRRCNSFGNLVPDAYLAAMAIDYGAILISADKDFRLFPELSWRHPLDPEVTTNPR